MRIPVLLLVLLSAACTPLSLSSSSEAVFDLLQDGVFVSTIKTVQLYPSTNDVADVLVPAVVPINQQSLRLEFDDLVNAYQYYTVKITHCNANWSKSGLSNLDYLTEYNSFPVNNYALSSDTHIPYVHYWFSVPLVKLGGNYVLTVYLNDTQPVLSKRFMVHQPLVQIGFNKDLSGARQLANKQGISLTMRYQKLEVMNAATQFETYLRQNQRWDNVLQNIPPSFIREDNKEIEYRVVDEEWMHDGGNEYRFVDLRSVLNTGQNIARIDRTVRPFVAYAATDRPRASERYSQYLDFNGNYVIQNYDNSLQYSANYVKTVFTLASSKPINGKVFLEGRLINNAFSKEADMAYDSAKKEYRKELLLKQGWYNYQYVVKGTDKQNTIEGSYFETENMYEVLVYYKSLQPHADILVGYAKVNKNPR
jgi:hypothetical protein